MNLNRTTLLLTGLMVASALHAQGLENRTLITVNGQKITGANYYKRMEVLPDTGKLINGQFLAAAPGFLTLQTLINEALMLQLAAEKGVTPTKAQIDEELKYRLQDNPDFAKAFEMLGFTAADVEYDLKVQLAEFNLTTMGINITDFQVEKHYTDNKIIFTIPKRYRIRLIAVDSASLKANVDAALAEGKTFGATARQYSKHLTKNDDGLMGDLPEDSVGENIKEIVTNLKEGQTTPWLKSQGTTEIKIFLEKVLPAEVVPLDDSLKRKIRIQLMLDRGRNKNNVPEMMKNMREKSTFVFSGTPFDEQLKQLYGKKD